MAADGVDEKRIGSRAGWVVFQGGAEPRFLTDDALRRLVADKEYATQVESAIALVRQPPSEL